MTQEFKYFSGVGGFVGILPVKIKIAKRYWKGTESRCISGKGN